MSNPTKTIHWMVRSNGQLAALVDARNRFSEAMPNHPLVGWRFEDQIRPHDDYRHIAETWVFRVNDPDYGTKAGIRLRQDFFELEEQHQSLTLLHEAIHVALMSGPCWSWFQETMAIEDNHCLDVFHQRYGQKRLVDRAAINVAVALFNFKHEIAAERFLQAQYPDFGPARAAFFVGNLQSERSDLQNVPKELQPFWLLYDLLRNELGCCISTGTSSLLTAAEELRELTRSALARSDRPNLGDLIPALMNVHPDPPVVDADVYRDLFEQALEARPPSPTF